ncbi:MAG: GNAT family N-acetyltransferase [Alphaproteobacteria bacterium]
MSDAKTATVAIAAATTPADIEEIRALFLEYGRSLDFNLCFQGFDEELASLPGAYAPPRGRLLLARSDDAVIGGVGLRPLEADICEMKRLYVRPGHRALKAGRTLAESAIAEARAIGYRAMRLDTLPDMTAAQALYATLGFRDIGPYYENPIPGARYCELDLTSLG